MIYKWANSFGESPLGIRLSAHWLASCHQRPCCQGNRPPSPPVLFHFLLLSTLPRSCSPKLPSSSFISQNALLARASWWSALVWLCVQQRVCAISHAEWSLVSPGDGLRCQSVAAAAVRSRKGSEKQRGLSLFLFLYLLDVPSLTPFSFASLQFPSSSTCFCSIVPWHTLYTFTNIPFFFPYYCLIHLLNLSLSFHLTPFFPLLLHWIHLYPTSMSLFWCYLLFVPLSFICLALFLISFLLCFYYLCLSFFSPVKLGGERTFGPTLSQEAAGEWVELGL